MKIWFLLGPLAALVLLAAVEVGLRLVFGFGNPPLYLADEEIGYVLAPNQRLRRFGNRIQINEYAMRSAAIAPLPGVDTMRLLLLGDSLANGGWWTDQADVLSARIAAQLESALPPDARRVEVLNASANSWGPRNELAYLERYGTFGASVLILMLNTDDLFGTQPTSLQVGHDHRYPNQKPASAIAEVIGRYFKKDQPVPGLEEIQAEGGDRVGKNLAAISAIYDRAVAAEAEFILVLSPLRRELAGPRDYELVARERLMDWATAAGIPYLDLLPTYQQQDSPEALYRDHIHLSPAGNELVSKAIARIISPLLSP